MPADIDVMLGITSRLPYSDNVFLDSHRSGDDKVHHNEDLTKLGNEEDKVGRRIRYGRDFLLSLQFLEQCKQRPPNLMNAEYIKKELPVGTRKNRKKIDLSMKEAVELKKADKQWVGRAEQEADLAKAEKEKQELFQRFGGILNKLTPQNFEILANQVLEMPIDSEDRLKGCIDKIKLKASEEPNYREAYDRLARLLRRAVGSKFVLVQFTN